MTKNELELKLIEAKAEVIALEKENTWLKSVIEKFADNKGTEYYPYRQWPYFWYDYPTVTPNITPIVGDTTWGTGTGDTFTVTNNTDTTPTIIDGSDLWNSDTVNVFANYSLS